MCWCVLACVGVCWCDWCVSVGVVVCVVGWWVVGRFEVWRRVVGGSCSVCSQKVTGR